MIKSSRKPILWAIEPPFRAFTQTVHSYGLLDIINEGNPLAAFKYSYAGVTTKSEKRVAGQHFVKSARRIGKECCEVFECLIARGVSA